MLSTSLSLRARSSFVLSITLLRQRCYLYQELLERAVTGHDSITNSKRRHGHFETFPYQQLRNSAALGFGG